VVAVHGVADQAPGASAAAVADLLVGRAEYGGSATRRLAIRVQRVPVSPREADAQGDPDCAPGRLELPPERGGYGQAFMRRQLECYAVDPADEVYDTTCVATSRTVPGAETIGVDVYEAYWADLSRLGQGAGRIFGELYQVIFHLGRLGHHSADHACRDAGGTRAWRAYSGLVSLAVAILTMPVPALNLLLLAVTSIVLPALLPDGWRGPVALLVLAILVLTLVGYSFFRAAGRVPRLLWTLLPALLVISVAAAALAGAKQVPLPIGEWNLLAVELSVLAFAAVVPIFNAYDRRRPGALRTALVIEVVLGSILWTLLATTTNNLEAVITAGLRVAEVGVVLLTLCFTSIFILGLAATVLGAALARGSRASGHAAVRATGTARLALSIASGAFLAFTLTAWAGLFAMRDQFVPKNMAYSPWLPWPGYGTWACQCKTVNAFLDQLLFGFVQYTGALPLFALMAAALLLAMWAVLPVVLAEVFPPKDGAGVAERYRTWLDRGFKLAAASGALLFAAVFLVMALAPLVTAVAARIASAEAVFYLTTCVSATGLLRAAKILGTAVVGISVARGRLEHLALGFRPVVDVALDVDNHLREHPWRANPRARICARYLSLLRALEKDYAGVVIVAHSQGSAITADLLRFLKYEKIPAPPRVFFFTMGCPLRQLYSERFPQLYDWAARPDPADLRVKRWVNAYRTGDYVGRALWEPAAPPANAEDVCIGGGAHTHYWDGTSDEVGARLDALVVEAARG
jgi:hypothetical protein